MSDYYIDVPVELRRRGRSKNVAGRGNRVVGWPVVQVVGTSRTFVAVLAAGVVLSGCASDEGEGGMSTTTSPPVAETPGNPWDLPIEQRPALFDPCAEIPVEAIEEGVGSPVRVDDELNIDRPGDLIACGWKNKEVIFGVLSTWKSRDEYLIDKTFQASESKILDRAGLRLLSRSDMGAHNCQQTFFSSRGTVFVSVDLIDGLASFKGAKFSDPCSVLEKSISPAMPYLPKGDF